jgi:hypothetical protein
MKVIEHNGRLTAFFKRCEQPSDCVYNSKEDMKKFCAKDCPFLMILLALLVFVSCKTPKTVTSSDHQLKTETERVDSVVGFAGDSANAALLIRCDSLGNAYLAELHTEQGKRIRLDIELRNAQRQLDSLGNLKPQIIYRNQPLYIRADCKEDSLQAIVHALRERISEYERNDTTHTEYVKYVPDYYRNCTKGFWWLLVIVILIAVWYFADYIPYLKTAKAFIKAYLHR